MSRRHLNFACQGAVLIGTLDEAPGKSGLLIVSGGNEIRSGAWSGQALLAARIAAKGFPVFRFDRRGVGDSEGVNAGFRASGLDIAAALAAFRAECPQMERVAALGNCDAASALMLAGGAGCDALVLANPWTIANADAPPSPQVLKAHYRRRLADPAAIGRLLSGKVSLSALLSSLRGALRSAPPPDANPLAREMAEGLARFAGPVAILLAEHDRTAQEFSAVWPKSDARVRTCPGAGHSFAEPDAREWLEERLLEVLRA